MPPHMGALLGPAVETTPNNDNGSCYASKSTVPSSEGTLACTWYTHAADVAYNLMKQYRSEHATRSAHPVRTDHDMYNHVRA